MSTPRGCDRAEVITVIRTVAIKGAGTEDDPVRSIIQYWAFDGTFLAQHDPVAQRGSIVQHDSN